MPTPTALGRLGFGDARLPHAILERLQLLTGVTFVGDRDAGRFLLGASPTASRLRGGVDRDRP